MPPLKRSVTFGFVAQGKSAVGIGATSLGGLALGAVAIGWKTVGAISLGMMGAQAALPLVMRAVRPGSGAQAPPQNSTADSSSWKRHL